MGRNKLLIPGRDGVAMVARVALTCQASKVDRVIVVLGHAAAAVRDAVPGVEFVVAAEHALGMSASLRAGIAAVPEEARAALVCLGDMPLVTPGTIDRLIEAHEAGVTVVPCFRGQRGNPVLWDRRAFAAMMGLSGDVGAKGLLGGVDARVVEVEDEGVVRDFDTLESLREGGWLV